jgi:hypothetical protein
MAFCSKRVAHALRGFDSLSIAERSDKWMPKAGV